MQYWASVPQRERNEWFIAYVYRDLPVCDPLQPLSVDEMRKISKDKRLTPPTNIAKLMEPLDPERWLQQVRDKWGAGEYRIRLNDQHPSVKQTVVECAIDAGRDWDSYPPVLDIATVVLSEPKNEPYLRWARLKGIKFPGDPDFVQEETAERESDEMAAITAVEKLTDALIQQSQQNSRPQPGPVVVQDSESKNTVAVMADAALKGQSILLDSIKAAQSATAKTQDPMEFHKAVMEASKVTAPAAPDNSALIMQMMKMQQDSNERMLAQQQEATRLLIAQMEKRLDLSEKAVADARAAQAAPAAPVVSPAVANPVKDAIDLIKGLASLRDTASGLLGGGEAAADEGLPPWAKIAGRVIDAAPNLLYNAAVLKNGGTPAPPPDLKQELIEQEQGTAAPGAEQPQQQEEPVLTKARIAQELATPLIESINRGDHGYQFAAGLMLTPKVMGIFSGRTLYEMAVEEGEQGMMAICQSYPPLWEKLILIPTRFQQFLSEFMNRDMANQCIQNANRPATPPLANGRAAEPKPARPQVPPHAGPVVNEAS